jgi:hypothetical protein
MHSQITDSGTGEAVESVTFDMDAVCPDLVSTFLVSCQDLFSADESRVLGW